MPRKFKPVRFFVLVALTVFVGTAITSFYTHRAAHGRTPDERAGYAIGVRVGADAPGTTTLPTAAALNMMAQQYFQQQGSGNQQDWDLGFARGYEDGFRKTHSQTR
jgi:hypothetical protein